MGKWDSKKIVETARKDFDKIKEIKRKTLG